MNIIMKVYLIGKEMYRGGLMRLPPSSQSEVKKCSLVIENKSDILYNISFMSSGGYYIYPNKNATLEEKKNCGIVKPGSKKSSVVM